MIFSGTHIHGSKIGLQRRINIETRTLCSNDKDLYSIPKMLIINQERQDLSGLNLFQTLKFIIVNFY